MQATREPGHGLRDALRQLFIALPPRGRTETERKHTYQLYHERLADLPVDLVHAVISEVIDSAEFLPTVAALRSLVLSRRARSSVQRPPDPAPRGPRSYVAQTWNAITRTTADSELVTGRCPRERRVDGVRRPCGREYEYTAEQARWLDDNRELRLCSHCAGEYLVRQAEHKARDAAWAERVLTSLSPNRRPTPAEVERLRACGYGAQLAERLVAIGAYSRRQP